MKGSTRGRRRKEEGAISGEAEIYLSTWFYGGIYMFCTEIFRLVNSYANSA
jgi:hypothetical protein